jgi:hypothetical protein
MTSSSSSSKQTPDRSCPVVAHRGESQRFLRGRGLDADAGIETATGDATADSSAGAPVAATREQRGPSVIALRPPLLARGVGPRGPETLVIAVPPAKE